MVEPARQKIGVARWRLPAVLAAAILLVSACPLPDAPLVHQEDFEDCRGPCGWEVTGPGTAGVVSTIHPGEHGMRLEGEVAITRRFDPPIDGASVAWVSEGNVTGLVAIDGPDGGTGEVFGPAPQRLDENGEPMIEEVSGGFRPYAASLTTDVEDTAPITSISFFHRDGDPPATVDAVRVLGAVPYSPGCY